MANEIATLGGSHVPAHLQQYQSQGANSLVTRTGSGPRISLKGRRFRLIKDGQETKGPEGAPLKVVILDASPQGPRKAKLFYKDTYAGEGDPPDCRSADGVKPDADVDNPQHGNCAQCRHNAWGSGKSMSGKKAKACKDIKRILVVRPDKIDSAPVFTMQVPVKSLKSLSEYGSELANHNLDPWLVTTEIAFVDSEYPQVEFKFAGYLDADQATKAVARHNSDEVRDLVVKPADVVTEDAADETPAPPPPPPAASAWDDEPEPKPEAQKPEVKAAPKADRIADYAPKPEAQKPEVKNAGDDAELNGILGAWGDST